MQHLNQQLTEYQLDAELARTTFTVTYKAHRVADDAPMLLLIIQPDFQRDAYFGRRFNEILQRNIQIDHPHILPVIPSAEVDKLLFMAMPIAENGMLLEDYLQREGALSVNDALSLIRQIGLALDFAHGQGMRHGDLNGKNIFIADGQLYIFGFGITQLYEDSTQKSVPPIADVHYLSSARLQGESSSRTADLFALGIWSYRLLTNEFPQIFNAATHKYSIPTALNQINPNVKASISDVVLRLLSRDMGLRHNTGAEFIRALQVASDGSTPIRPITAANLPMKPMKPLGENSFSLRGFAYRRYFTRIVFLIIIAIGASLGGYWLINRFGILGESINLVEITATPTPTRTALPAPIVITPNPTATPIPSTPTTPATPTAASTLRADVTEGSPFSQLRLARDISDDYQAIDVNSSFPANVGKLYLFYRYQEIEAGTVWGVEWRRSASVVEFSSDTWPQDYGSAGTAWSFYAPIDGFEPGQYSVSLSVDGTIVATTTFTIVTN